MESFTDVWYIYFTFPSGKEVIEIDQLKWPKRFLHYHLCEVVTMGSFLFSARLDSLCKS